MWSPTIQGATGIRRAHVGILPVHFGNSSRWLDKPIRVLLRLVPTWVLSLSMMRDVQKPKYVLSCFLLDNERRECHTHKLESVFVPLHDVRF
jgi:hypothetical protein